MGKYMHCIVHKGLMPLMCVDIFESQKSKGVKYYKQIGNKHEYIFHREMFLRCVKICSFSV